MFLKQTFCFLSSPAEAYTARPLASVFRLHSNSRNPATTVALVDGQKYLAVGWLEKNVRSKTKNKCYNQLETNQSPIAACHKLVSRALYPGFSILFPMLSSEWMCFASCSDRLIILQRFTFECQKVIGFALPRCMIDSKKLAPLFHPIQK